MTTFVLAIAAITAGAIVGIDITNPTPTQHQLEDLGCEVVEDQTDDYDIQDLGTIDDEIGVVPINKLLTSTDFIAN
jgi:hypothetical protein